MKIVFVTNSHQGRDGRLYYRLARTLANEHSVSIVTPMGSDEPGNPAIITARGGFKNLTALYYTTLAQKPQAIICVEPLTMLVGLLLKKRLGCRLYWDYHEFFVLAARDKGGWLFALIYGLLVKYLARYADGILTVNHLLSRKFIQPVCELPNYPLSTEPTPVAPAEYDWIYTGGIGIDKGMDKMLRATALLKKQGHPVKGLLVGPFHPPAQEAVYHKLVNELGIADCLTHIPRVLPAQIPEFLARAKVGICLLNPAVKRYRVAIATKQWEYMQAGLPVIVNNLPLPAAPLQKYQAGLTCEYNSAALAKALQSLLKHDRTSMRQAGIKAIKEEYNWDTCATHLTEFFQAKEDKNLLFFSYFYPPLGGPGVQRPLRMIKAWQEAGWKVTVITVGDIVFHSHDYGLAKDDCASECLRTASLDPMAMLKKAAPAQARNKVYFSTPEKLKTLVRNLFPIDDKIGWLPFALKAAEEAIGRKKYRAVVATMGPYTSGVAAYIISRRHKLPLVLDYRDHWTLNPYLSHLTPVHKAFHHYVEKAMLRKAAVVSVISRAMQEELEKGFRVNNVHTIYNGWDEDDFTNLPAPAPPDGLVRCAYVGNFYGNRRVDFLIKALLELKREGNLPGDLRFRFTGNFYRETAEMLKHPQLEGWVEVQDQVEHHRAIAEEMAAQALMIFIATSDGRSVLTGKIFEYLRTGKPILAMLPPDGEAATILRTHQHTNICPMEDIPRIKELIITMYKRIKSNSPEVVCFPDRYSRRDQSLALLKLIEQAL